MTLWERATFRERIQATVLYVVIVAIVVGLVALALWGMRGVLGSAALIVLSWLVLMALILVMVTARLEDHLTLGLVIRSRLLTTRRRRSINSMNETLVESANKHVAITVSPEHMDSHKSRVLREAKSIGDQYQLGKVRWFDSPVHLARHLHGRRADFYMSRGAGVILDIHHEPGNGLGGFYSSGSREATDWADMRGYMRGSKTRNALAEAVAPLSSARRAVMSAAAEEALDLSSPQVNPEKRTRRFGRFFEVTMQVIDESVGAGSAEERSNEVARFLGTPSRRNLSEEFVAREAVKHSDFCTPRERSFIAATMSVFDACDNVIVAMVGGNIGQRARETFLIAPPTERHVDENGRLHNESGPAITYVDGWSLYFLHGVRVPESLVMGQWSVEDVLEEPNAEVRRAAIEMMGWEHFIEDGGFTLIDSDDDPGNPGNRIELYELPVLFADYGESRILLCTNGTVERDGTSRKFGLLVPADRKTAVEAAAWTYDIPVKQYVQAARRA